MFTEKGRLFHGWEPILCTTLFVLSLVCILPNSTIAQEFSSGDLINGPCSACNIDVARPADLDSDGDQDILVGAEFSYIGWFENTESGFSNFKMITKDPGAAPVYENQGVIATDFSGDGSPDLLSGLLWYENSGNGTFSERKRVSTGSNRFNIPSKTADVTGDGREDVVAFLNNELVYFENGNFGNAAYAIEVSDLSSEGYIYPNITLGDVNGDGDTDIVATYGRGEFNNSSFYLAWYENLGNGKFGDEQFIETGGMVHKEIHVADLDGDGDLDVLSSRGTQSGGVGKYSWYENTDGDGTFGSENIIEGTEKPPFVAYAREHSQPIDIDQDGDQDIVAYNKSGYEIAVVWYENNGDGSFQSPVKLEEGPAPSGPIEKGDLNGDGLADILYPTADKGQVKWHPNLENGILGEQQTVGKKLNLYRLGNMFTADIYQNEHNDLLMQSVTNLENILASFKNTGTGFTYQNPILDRKVGEPLLDLVFEDMDKDSDPDIVYTARTGETRAEYQYYLKWAENDGNGNYTHHTITDRLGNPSAITIGDIDGDSNKDVLVLANNNIKIFPNLNGSIGSNCINIDAQSLIKKIVTADVDGDNDLDLIVSYPDHRGNIDDPNALIWYENQGTGWDFSAGQDGFSNPKVILEGNAFLPSKATDVDNDGDVDILGKRVWIENKDGKGTFSDPVETGAQVVADMDADGDPDLLRVNTSVNYSDAAWRGIGVSWIDVDYGFRKVWWRENQGGTFASKKVLVEETDRPSSLQAFDLNKDGAKDLVYRSEDYTKIEWFKNTGVKVETNAMATGDSAAFGATSARLTLSDNTTGNGKVIISKANRRPVGSQGINTAYTAGIRMVLRSEGDLEIGDESKIFFDLGELPNVNDPGSVSIFKRDTVDRGSFQELNTTYNETTNHLSTKIDTTGELVFANKYPPKAVADTFSVREDSILTQTTSVVENDRNPQSEELDITLISDVTNGELTFNPDGSFEYVPETEFDSTDSFTYQITDGFSTSQTTVIINVKTQDINVSVGGSTDWQLVAFPFVSSTKTQLFTEDKDNWLLYKFNGSYSDAREIVAGQGYWLKSKNGSQTEVHEDPNDTLSVELNSGWNLIGGVNDTLAVTDVVDENDIIMESTLYGFDRIYQAADSIRAGKGYWLRAKEPGGTIKLIKGLSKDKTSARIAKVKSKKTIEERVTDRFNKIFISISESKEQKFYVGGELPKGVHRKAFSLPPKPPSSMFDARFKDGFRLTEDSHPRFQMQRAESPLTIRLETATQVEQKRYAVEAIRDDNVLMSRTLYENNPVRIFDNNIDYLKLSEASSSADSEIPREFHLEQNYPNPFNPSTTIKFGLPKATNVKITVYDILGRRVRTLANGHKKAGWHTIKFNGNRMASGVYFYRLKTSAWTKTRRFLLVK